MSLLINVVLYVLLYVLLEITKNGLGACPETEK